MKILGMGTSCSSIELSDGVPIIDRYSLITISRKMAVGAVPSKQTVEVFLDDPKTPKLVQRIVVR